MQDDIGASPWFFGRVCLALHCVRYLIVLCRPDRVIEWPKSTGLAVSRPKSASAAEQGMPEVLPNGIPHLPADLTFAQPPQQTSSQVQPMR